ncbi:hypothetical protein B0H17DRAFT_1142894 [Mycena rosella]|uniref:Uncharacterized protein n=1 Tax=Mycena rosella TaxID=1033263 RepID=A0AAD7CWZ0_MYCRO|nr:hypothetical protein B0H17DRAFT_1142894 [Mycena rosella]
MSTSSAPPRLPKSESQEAKYMTILTTAIPRDPFVSDDPGACFRRRVDLPVHFQGSGTILTTVVPDDLFVSDIPAAEAGDAPLVLPQAFRPTGGASRANLRDWKRILRRGRIRWYWFAQAVAEEERWRPRVERAARKALFRLEPLLPLFGLCFACLKSSNTGLFPLHIVVRYRGLEGLGKAWGSEFDYMWGKMLIQSMSVVEVKRCLPPLLLFPAVPPKLPLQQWAVAYTMEIRRAGSAWSASVSRTRTK